ncbi:LCP family protein [Halobacillus salinus]|uniref:Transcriptional regulator LytR n=1 Tax=Halobacillus salinus TaxID=192814 RepID=A0A4Z0GVV2_9BACI|nr:LCP family protein [Halobacillus salinus]TGB01708.1 transcriptional regulator LytR [Halobacillus salinus]
MSRVEKRKKKKRGRWWKILLLIVLVIGGATLAYGFSVYSGAKQTVNKEMHEQVSSIDVTQTKAKIDKREPLNILLMGVDERDGDVGRSDALMVMTVDPENERSQLISIPRDTRTEMVGNDPQSGNLDKINHAYAFGGTDMAVQTVENFLDIELDYYAKVNMEGLADMVDALGGITVTNDFQWSRAGFNFPEGELTLNGEETMQFVRMRKQDPKGDLGRNGRQREAIQGIMEKGANIGAVNKIGDIMNVLGSNVKTNMDFETMRNLALNYSDARKSMTTYQMSGSGTKIGGIYYLQIPEQEVNDVHKMITDYNS